MAAETAQKLAWYKAGLGLGVLAPRGWHCFGTYGSSGSELDVSPKPIDHEALLHAKWPGFEGPVIEVSFTFGDTFGRFAVARVIARVFPAHADFVKSVSADNIEAARDFPAGPYRRDKLVRKSPEVVEYQTPVGADGLGTRSRLRKGGGAIFGVAILTFENDLVQLSARLPKGLMSLAPAIIQQVESDAARNEWGAR